MASLKSRLNKFKRLIGPGVVTGGSDNDPAGIVTYSTVGALFGYALIWLMVVITPLMVVLQEMAGRVALVQKRGLARIVKENYGYSLAFVSVLILAVANIATIAADLAGIAAVLGVIFNVSFLYFIVPIALLISGIILFEDYREIRRLLLSLAFLLVLYIFSALFAYPDWSAVLTGLIPSFSASTLFLGAVIGVIGTTISPYMLFWQASEEVEENHRLVQVKEMNIDTVIGMGWSNLVAIFIIIAAGATLFKSGIAPDNVADIALALQPVAGEWSYLLFALGIIVSGFIALPVLAGSTAYAVADIFHWREGLSKKIHLAKGFYLVIVLSIAIGALLSFLPINPVHFLYYTQILNGFLTPFLIGVLMLLCNNRSIMKEKRYLNTRRQNAIAIISFIIIVILDIFLAVDLFRLF